MRESKEKTLVGRRQVESSRRTEGHEASPVFPCSWGNQMELEAAQSFRGPEEKYG